MRIEVGIREYLARVTVIGSLSTLLVISVAMNVTLVNRLAARRPARGSVLAGTKLPPLVATDQIGATRSVSFERRAQPTLLYVFSPTCPWCAKNSENFRALVARIGGRFNVVALSLSDVEVVEPGRSFPVYWHPTVASRKAYGLGPTPDTLVVGTDGRIAKRWSGAWDGSTKRDVESYFGVSLPGLADRQPSTSVGHGI